MSEQGNPPTQPPAETPPQDQIDQGAYEVIRNRLNAHGKELRTRLDKLNAHRKEVFGSIDFKLTGTDRITTPNNCIPRDIVAVGGRFLMGFNVHFGLKTHVDLGDVFAVYRFGEGSFHEEDLSLLDNADFRKDFIDLFRFYKNAEFAKFFRRGPHLYMKFHVGRDVDDFKAFKWMIDGEKLSYLGNRSDHEVRYPDQHDFTWQRATRDMQTQGAFPHYSIEDLVFVETTGGDLTIKVENNTDSGEGLYAEPVDNPDQALDDAIIYYAIHGHLVLLRIRPYQEDDYRYFIFNTKLQEVIREDSIGEACVLLPEDHGLAFTRGYYLASGKHQHFPGIPEDLVYERKIIAPNGEDFAFVFYHRRQGVYVILPYNLIDQAVDTPITANGYAFFGDGQVVFFKSPDDAEPQKHHAVQVWQTPFVSPDHVTHTENESYLFKVGNRDIVRGMAECVKVLDLVNREELYAQLYLDLVKSTSDLLDTYFWLEHAEASQIAEPLQEIKRAAQAAVGEYEKVTRIRKATERQVGEVTREVDELVNANAARIYDNILVFVEALAGLRELRGRIIALRELRYIDPDHVDQLEQEVKEQTESLSQRCVQYLLDDKSLDPYRRSAEAHEGRIDALTKAADAKALSEDVQKGSDELEMLIEIVSNLQIDDATQRTEIIDRISEIFSRLNATRSRLRNKQQELGRTEGIAEFNSQLKLLNQTVVNYLDMSDDPEKTEQFLTKVMLQVEGLEGRFAEYDDFVLELTEKREEIYTAFENRKLQLIEKRNKRAEALGQAADRILQSVQSRVQAMEQVTEIHSYFASDLLIDKVRDIIADLTVLEDTVRVDDIQSRLKTIREDAVRQLKDRQDLQADGKNTIRFGRHVFSVNNQAIDLTTIVRDDTMHLHLTGTQFFESIDDPRLEATRDAWPQEVVSEDATVYRAEYLAYLLLNELLEGDPDDPRKLLSADEDVMLEHVRQFMGPRYHEGYTKGVHDADAAAILRALLEMHTSIDLLRYRSNARALANLWWKTLDDEQTRSLIAHRLSGFGTIGKVFPDATEQQVYITELKDYIAGYADQHDLLDSALAEEAGEYLFFELTNGSASNGMIVSPEASELSTAFHEHLRQERSVRKFQASADALDESPFARFSLAYDWAKAFLDAHTDFDPDVYGHYLYEFALLLFDSDSAKQRVHPAVVRRELTGLIGAHPLIRDGKYTLTYNTFITRLNHYFSVKAPRYETYSGIKHRVLEEARDEMRIEEFKPKVLTSFVRNKLIDKVFLPLIGDNLAKQMGTAGADTRTDRMGLLLLISPPGYGKTTLMEYIANRLGVVFMKINGPAIGHTVTSIDPSEATNAAAREELEKLNLAFEMGDNVVIYVDDIQHTSSEFLQKFISLCDAQRRIEGVYKGKTRTYDFRGRKIAVVMAGNPYTESGERFKIPDMLANRADTYNLGDIIGDHGDAFRQSYLENCLTSNPTLNPLASRSQQDIYGIIKIAETDSREGVELQGNYSREDVDEMVTVVKKLITVRDVILRVNEQYIASAGQEDQYRTEPAFQLQGSYRNMNRIAEKIVPVMNDDELQTLIMASYEQDAQTLTTGAEANLLKFREMMGWLTEEEAKRWEDIKRTFQRNNAVQSLGGDERTAAVLSQMAGLNQNLGDIKGALTDGLSSLNTNGKGASTSEPLRVELGPLAEQMAGFADRLAGIGDALQSALQQQASAQTTTAPASMEAKLDETTLQAIRDLTQKLGGQMAGATATTDSGPAPQAEPSGQEADQSGAGGQPVEVRVVNKIPATFLYVMKEQFELMKSWMEPLTRITADQDDQLKHMRSSIEEIVGRYDDMIQRLEKNQGPSGD